MATVLLVVLIVVVAFVLAAYAKKPNKPIDVPVGLSVTLLGGNEMADVLTYQVSVGLPVSHDVVQRELSFVIDGADPVVSVFSNETTDLGTVNAPEGANVVLSLVDIDNAGNRSDAAVLSFEAVDTLPPAVPGSFGVTLVGESKAEEPKTDEDVPPVDA